jgi:hypothetical protein
MSDYVKSTNFAAKDALSSGDTNKIVKGTEINTEYDNIATAVSSKADKASPTFTGTVNVAALTASSTITGNVTGAVTGSLAGGTGLPLTTGVTGTLPVANGGTNQTTYTNGQLLIGNTTGNTLSKSTLTAGSGISITNGTGTITIASTAGTVTSVATGNGLSGGTITTSGTLVISAPSAGSVGSYMTGQITSNVGSLSFGSTFAGSSFTTNGATWNGCNRMASDAGISSTQSGTWQFMGSVTGTGNMNFIMFAVRVS